MPAQVGPEQAIAVGPNQAVELNRAASPRIKLTLYPRESDHDRSQYAASVLWAVTGVLRIIPWLGRYMAVGNCRVGVR